MEIREGIRTIPVFPAAPWGREGASAWAWRMRGIAVAWLLAAAGCTAHPRPDFGGLRPEVVEEARGADRGGPPSSPGASEGVPTTEDPFGPEATDLDLRAVLAYALEHNTRVRAARLRYQALHARADAAGWLPDPRLSWSHGFEEIQTRNGPIRDVFSITQAFPYFGRLRAEGAAAGALADEEREAFLATQLEVLRDVQQA